MRAGDLKYRITIQEFTSSDTDYGTQPVWADKDTVWAGIEYDRGRERYDAERDVNTQMTTFLIRHRTDLTVDMRIQFDGDVWDIAAIHPEGFREGLRIEAERTE